MLPPHDTGQAFGDLGTDIGATAVGEAVGVALGIPHGVSGSVVLVALLAGRILTALLRWRRAVHLSQAASSAGIDADQLRQVVRDELRHIADR